MNNHKLAWHLKEGPFVKWELCNDSGNVIATVSEGMLGWMVKIGDTYTPGFNTCENAKKWAQKRNKSK